MSAYVKPQPAPVNQDDQCIWPLVIDELEATRSDGYPYLDLLLKDCRQRNLDGIKKHGVPLCVRNGRDAAVDALQEALDGLVYWRQEVERTGDTLAIICYRTAIILAKLSREYLYRRDGQ